MSDVSVNGGWDVDNVGVDLIGLEKLGDLDRVSQTVSGADNDEASNTVLLARVGQWLKVSLVKLVL